MDTDAEVKALIRVRRAGLLILFVDGAACVRDGYVLRVGRASRAAAITAASGLGSGEKPLLAATRSARST